MADNPAVNTCKITVSGGFSDANWANVFWTKIDTSFAPSVEQLSTLADDVGHLWTDNFGAIVADAVTIDKAQAVLWVDLGAALEGTSAIGTTGASADNFQAANVAAVIAWHDGSYYRGGKPHSFIPGVHDSQVFSAKELTVAAAAAYADAANAFCAAVNALVPDWAGSVTLGCQHFMHGGLAFDPGVFQPFVEGSATCRRKFGTLRRRLANI